METGDRIRKCRAHAEQCRVHAELSHHASVKKAFLEAAREWEKLAGEIEDIERKRLFTSHAGEMPRGS